MAVAGDVAELEAVISAAQAGDQRALRVLPMIQQPAARPLLESVVARGGVEPKVVTAALSGLATIASPLSWGVMKRVLDARPHPAPNEASSGAIRAAGAIRYFARVNSEAARDELCPLLEEPRWQRQAGLALGATGDRRATPALLEVARQSPHDRFPDGPPRTISRKSGPFEVLAHLGDPVAIGPLVELLEETLDVDRYVQRRIADTPEPDLAAEQEEWRQITQRLGVEMPDHVRAALDPATAGESRIAQFTKDAPTHARATAWCLRHHPDPAGTEAVERIEARNGTDLRPPSRYQPPNLTPIPTDQLVVDAWALDYQPGAIDDPRTRFGGQPTWLGDPAWPLTIDGTPMAFWAQFELPDYPNQLAYLFIDMADGVLPGLDPGSAALFLQPGTQPDVPYSDQATGPTVPNEHQIDTRYDPEWPHHFTAQVPRLVPYEEPDHWDPNWATDQRSWDKIAGTPYILQGEPDLGPDWTQIFQFSAHQAGHELADGAQCYGWLNTTTHQGHFYWDCS
ncbi:MAG: DUF1963 domain-containing protein [Actinomycetia bacterium]|nr:DUF1963 domain-containing protein [Actinomycetes bacterium]